MQFSEQWLRTPVDPRITTDGLPHLLSMSGLEVESPVSLAPPFTVVVVEAEVLAPSGEWRFSLVAGERECGRRSGGLPTPADTDLTPATIDARFPVRISEPKGCGRFAGRVIRNVNAEALTPEWMKRRLE